MQKEWHTATKPLKKSAKLAHLTLFKFFIERGRRFFSLCVCFITMAMLQLYKAIRPASGYAVDETPTSHPPTAKVFATVRNNGRLLDDMKIVIGGTGIFEANFKVKKLITDDVIESWSVNIQRWARDIVIRDGLLSSLWADLSTIMSARDATIHDSHRAGIPAAEFLRLLDEAEDGDAQAALRWAVADFLVSDSV
jgi:hypothetical protein